MSAISLGKCAPRATPEGAWEKVSASLLKRFQMRNLALAFGWKLSKVSSRSAQMAMTRQVARPMVRPVTLRKADTLFLARWRKAVEKMALNIGLGWSRLPVLA